MKKKKKNKNANKKTSEAIKIYVFNVDYLMRDIF